MKEDQCAICEWFEYTKQRDKDWSSIDAAWAAYIKSGAWESLRKRWELPINDNWDTKKSRESERL